MSGLGENLPRKRATAPQGLTDVRMPDGSTVPWEKAFPRPAVPSLPPGYVPRWEREES